MKIKKLGHCCFIAEPKVGVRVMTDPGVFSTSQHDEKNINIIIISHEHQDHFHVDSLKKVLENNPSAVVITNTAVGKLLDAAGIKHSIIDQGKKEEVLGVPIVSFGNIHAEIYGDAGRVQNTGYMIDSLCYPGDAFESPNCAVDILALPVAGPWMALKEAIDYAKMVKPRIAFPVHDAILQPQFTGFIPQMIGHILSSSNIQVKSLELGKEENL